MTRVCRTSTSIVVATLLAGQAQAQDVPVELPPIFLGSALRESRNILDTPVTGSVRTRGDLESRQANTFEELIRDIPGVVIEGGPRGISQEPNIRGFQDEQIVLRFDGGRFNFNQAHRGRFFFDPDIVQRVEVIRGGGSTLFGSGALGGVISVDTKDASDLLAPGQTVGGRVRLGYASNGDIGSASGTFYGDWGAFDALGFIATRQMGEDLESGDGVTVRNSEIDLVNGLLKFGYEPTPDQRFEFSLSRYQDEGTTPPNANAVSSNNDVDRDADVTTGRLSWDYAPEGSNALDVSVLLYGNALDITEDRLRDGRADETEYTTYGIEVVNRSRFNAGVPVTFVYGFEAFEDSQTGTRNGADRRQFPDATATTIGIFGEATFELNNRLDLVAGVRFDDYSRNPDDPTVADVSKQFWSPRLGMSYRPHTQWQLYGNGAQAFRAPTWTELYNGGVHFAAPGFPLQPGVTFSGVNTFVPNPNLEEEESDQVEIGVRFVGNSVWQTGDALSFSANAYYADVKNFIESNVAFIDFSTAVPGPGGLVVGGTTSSQNVDAELWGFEAELSYGIGPWFADAGLSIARGEKADGTLLGSIPQDRLTATLGYRAGPDWTLGGRVTLADSQEVPDGAPPANGYQLVDLFASWQPSTGPLAGITVYAGVDNVFDELYQIYPNGLSQPGRTFKISTAIQF